MTDTPPAQTPTGVQDLQVAAPEVTPAAPAPTPAAPPPAPVGDGPWAADLATMFPDEAARAQVDQFLRTKVQPYTTQLEQQSAGNKDALKLWNDLNESPLDTYVAMTTEMFGEEAGLALLNDLQQRVAAAEQGQQPAPQQPGQQPQYDPRTEAALQYVENKQANDHYESEIARIKAEHPEVNTDFIHPFVHVADGNFDEGVRLYTEYLASLGESQGLFQTPETPAAPPAVLGSDTATQTPSSTPTEPRKQTIAEAVEDFVAEQRANREAPPVGTA